MAVFLSTPMLFSQSEQPFTTRDTLSIPDDTCKKTQAYLKAIAWEPESFEVKTQQFKTDHLYIRLHFPSPLKTEYTALNTVIVEGYFVTTDDYEVIQSPAVVILHSLHPDLVLARSLARLLRNNNIHAFVVQMPGFQQRRPTGISPARLMLTHAGQAIADARRTADVIESLPYIQGKLGLVGISMGGFVATSTASLDSVYDPVILLFSGHSAAETILDGEQDARLVREQLFAHGWTPKMIREMLESYEPEKFAHRLNPSRTWLVSAEHDVVVRPEHARKLADIIKLPDDHHRWIHANHYTATIFLPGIAQWISQIMLDSVE